MTEKYTEKMKKGLKYWLSFPDPENNPEDNIWHDFHIFDGHWIPIQNRQEWYESPNVPGIYSEHKYIFKQNMDMGRPEETYYEQNVDDGSFASNMYVTEGLPSGKGDLKIETEISTKYAPSGENNFCLVDYVVTTEIKYSMPKGVTFLPRIVARPLNRFFKKAFLKHIGEELIEYDGEYARERSNEYFQYLRKYHGEEPTQSKSRQSEFKPVPEEGVFFQ